MGCQAIDVDDVDVRLRELAESALLRALAAPHLLHLVAAQREIQTRRVLHDEAREGHGEVEVQRQRILVARLAVQAAYGVHLLVDLPLAQEYVDRLHAAGLQGGEAVELEDAAHRVEHLELDEAAFGEPLRESRQAGRARHHRPLGAGAEPRSARKGLVARSRPIVVVSP